MMLSKKSLIVLTLLASLQAPSVVHAGRFSDALAAARHGVVRFGHAAVARSRTLGSAVVARSRELGSAVGTRAKILGSAIKAVATKARRKVMLTQYEKELLRNKQEHDELKAACRHAEVILAWDDTTIETAHSVFFIRKTLFPYEESLLFLKYLFFREVLNLSLPSEPWRNATLIQILGEPEYKRDPAIAHLVKDMETKLIAFAYINLHTASATVISHFKELAEALRRVFAACAEKKEALANEYERKALESKYIGETYAPAIKKAYTPTIREICAYFHEWTPSLA